MTRRLGALLISAGCLAAGCTAIVYGDDPSRQGSGVASGTAPGAGGKSPAAPPESGGEASASSGRGTSTAGAGGAEPQSIAGAGGAAETAGAAGDRAGGGAGGAGAAGEPAREAGGSGSGGDTSAAGGPAGGEGGAPDGSGAAGAPPISPGDTARGYRLVVLNNCYRCHGSDLAGRGFYRNITPDEVTGIGSWSDAQIARGIAGGTNASGELLCASMPIYSGLSPQDMADMIAFLRSIPARHNPITLVCPGHDP